MPHRGSESDFELTTIERLEGLGYRDAAGKQLERALRLRHVLTGPDIPCLHTL